METDRLAGITAQISRLSAARPMGRVRDVDGAVIEVAGLGRQARIGDRLELIKGDGTRLRGEALRLSPGGVTMLSEDGLEGVAHGDTVLHLGPQVLRPCETWIGRVIDAYGRPLDGACLGEGGEVAPYRRAPPPAAARRPLGPRLRTGLAVFDTILPIVQGQRLGVFAGSGVGKSRLLGELIRGVEADVVVLTLIGERGRELGEFVGRVLGSEGMERTVVIAATSDTSALERRRSAHAGMAVAEYFRDQGARVLFLADSITRFAEAHREVALASGELPAARGYPASLGHEIMGLAERAGPGSGTAGDITAIFTVLVAGSDMDEPVADILRGTLDGHVVLDREIAERGRFPAIDPLRSVSRSLPDCATEAENATIAEARRLMGRYAQSETMVRAGMYRPGTDPQLDTAIRAWPELDGFVAERQSGDIAASFARLELILRRAKSTGPQPGAGGQRQGEPTRAG